jgi:sigma-B regulation protein RsbU (phosphoserine phosphatase)
MSALPTGRPEGAADEAHPVTVLLVDDQEIVAAAVRRMLEDEPDIRFHYCGDPTKAIETAGAVKPTVILQDLVMPEIDGMSLVRFFRANAATADIPMIVLSSKEEPAVKAEAFACGANDYMVKFPDKLEVVARVRYHSRGYIALQQRNEAYDALAEELAEAAEYVRKLLPEPREEGPRTSWHFVPSTQLGGDSFGYHWIDDDHFAVYLLDVCGHGVGAALLSVSVMNVVGAQSLPGTDFRRPAAVLNALNNAFPMEKHNQRFFTMWYGVFNRRTRELVYANGGHPPALLLAGGSAADAAEKRLGKPGMLVGMMEGTEYDEERITIESFGMLFLFSDGAYEITKQSDGEVWTYEEWIDLLTPFGRRGETDLAPLHQHIVKLRGAENLEDDFSLLQVLF